MISACAVAPPRPAGPVMIPGKMFNLKDGTLFDLQIERSSGIGTITARNLATGEVFTGNYSAMVVDGGVSVGTYRNAWGTETGSVTTQSAATRGVGKGVLRGASGTIISFTLDIKPSYNPNINPSGFGEGTDNNGVTYQLQFGGN